MMKLLRKLKLRNSTHECPSCKGPAYCAITDGKSSSACWCMTVSPEASKDRLSLLEVDECLCKKCLTKPEVS